MGREPTYHVVHADETLLVVDKAPGVLTVGHPGGSERCLLDDLRRDGHAVAPVHRLDRETSGLLLLCLDPAARADLEALFRRREVVKEYLGLVVGRPAEPRATIDVPILDTGKAARVDRRGQRAVTRYEVVEAGPAASLLRLTLETGRHNQIRVHMAHIGHPLVGDRKYGRRPRERGAPAAPRALLHAARLALTHPRSGRPLDLRSDPPADFRHWQEQLLGARGRT